MTFTRKDIAFDDPATGKPVNVGIDSVDGRGRPREFVLTFKDYTLTVTRDGPRHVELVLNREEWGKFGSEYANYPIELIDALSRLDLTSLVPFDARYVGDAESTNEEED